MDNYSSAQTLAFSVCNKTYFALLCVSEKRRITAERPQKPFRKMHSVRLWLFPWPAKTQPFLGTGEHGRWHKLESDSSMQSNLCNTSLWLTWCTLACCHPASLWQSNQARAASILSHTLLLYSSLLHFWYLQLHSRRCLIVAIRYARFESSSREDCILCCK